MNVITSGLPRFAMNRILAVIECSSLAKSAGKGAESSVCWNSLSWECGLDREKRKASRDKGQYDAVTLVTSLKLAS